MTTISYETFTLSTHQYAAELTSQSHQTLYWLNRQGYLSNEDTTELLKRMIVVPIKNQPKFGQRLIERFFGKDSDENSYVFPITLLEDGLTQLETPTGDKPNLKVIK